MSSPGRPDDRRTDPVSGVDPDDPVDPDLTTPGRRRAGTARRWRADVVAVIAVGGALGGVARYGIALLVPTRSGGFPWSTWLENVSGSLLLALLMVLVVERLPPGRYLRPFLGVGVLGGYTTFSTYTTDVDSLLRGDQASTAFAYLFGTVAACLLASWLGLHGGRALLATSRPRPRGGRG